MGMINSLKLGYKSNYLRTLLRIFDTDGGYERQALLRAQQPRGCKGIVYGGKPTVLDCMIMLKEIWDGESDKYVTSEGIMRC